jgi:hypothetical protein
MTEKNEPLATANTNTELPEFNVNATNNADAPGTAVASSRFSIGAEVKAFNRKDFNAGISINVKLVDVKLVTRKVQEEEKVCIEFSFKDGDGREYNHLEWPIDEMDANFDKKFEGFRSRIAHLAAVMFGSVPANVFVGNSLLEFYTNIATYFKTNQANYAKKLLAIKLVYNGKNLAFPLSPNFVDVMKHDNKHTLTINPRWDRLTPTGGSSFGGDDAAFNVAGGDLPGIEI